MTLPTIDIHGKQYILVKDRVLSFHELCPKGSIETELLSKPEDLTVVFKATVKPDSDLTRSFTGHSQAKVGGAGVNREAAMENAETSAVGRALGMLGIGIIDSLASADEIVKAGVILPQKPSLAQDKNELPFGNEEVCPKCNAPMKISKTKGTPFCSALCWKPKQ